MYFTESEKQLMYDADKTSKLAEAKMKLNKARADEDEADREAAKRGPKSLEDLHNAQRQSRIAAQARGTQAYRAKIGL